MKTKLNAKQASDYAALKQSAILAREQFKKGQDDTYAPFSIACDRINHNKLSATLKWECSCVTSENMLATALTKQAEKINNDSSDSLCLIELGSLCNNPHSYTTTPFFVKVKMPIKYNSRLTSQHIILKHDLSGIALKTLRDLKPPDDPFKYAPDHTFIYAKSVVFKWRCLERWLVPYLREDFMPGITAYNSKHSTAKEAYIESFIGYGSDSHPQHFVQVRIPL